KREAIFCFPCIIFNASQPSNSASSLTNPARGFNDWRHLSPRIPDHENSVLHRENISIDFKFVCTLDVWLRILTAIDRVNKSLQLKKGPVDKGARMIQGLIKQIQNIRDENFEETFDRELKLSDNIGIEGDFVEKKRRPKKQDAHNICYDQISVFLSIYSLKNITVENLRKQATHLALKYEDDINPAEFSSELETSKFQAYTLFADSESVSPLDLLKALHQFSLAETCPNVNIALRIFLTLPVTVASCERSFSKLKLIKTYLAAFLVLSCTSCPPFLCNLYPKYVNSFTFSILFPLHHQSLLVLPFPFLNLIILVLSTFSSNLFLSRYSSILPAMLIIPSSSSESSTISSMYSSVYTFLCPNLISPYFTLPISFSKSAITMLNSNGLSGHPCLIPLAVQKFSPIFLPALTMLFYFV
ncbi:hypothetical protein ALC57_07912, partial [Trachymyrmex cornetzi]